MKKLLFIIVLWINFFANAQNVMCDSIMKQMDFEIKNAKANGYDASILKQLEDTKQMLKKMYCENNNYGGNGIGNNENPQENQNPQENNPNYSQLNIPKQRPYKGTPFYGKQKISITVKSSVSEGNQNNSYSYYLNKDGSLVLLDKECLANANTTTIPQFSEGESGEFQYWAIRKDGISTVFALSKENRKVAVTTDIQNFMFSEQNNVTPTIKKLNKIKKIAGYLCNAYEITYKEDASLTMTCWITTNPLSFNHHVVPFMTMYSADNIGFKNLKNHGVLEMNLKNGTETAEYTVTSIQPANKSVFFNGYKEFYVKY
jgi:hypothetical protein